MRHRRVPPYPAWPAIREQGGRFWARFLTAMAVALLFVLIVNRWPVMAADHAEILHTHETYEER